MMTSKKGLDLLKGIASFMTKTEGFDKCLRDVVIKSGGNGLCRAEFIVEKEHLNRAGGLHGGFTATLVDVITTYALMTKNIDEPKAGVSVDIHISYLKGAREGDVVEIDAKTIKMGGKLAFLECELKHKNDGSIIARGTQTKYVGHT